MLAAVVGRFVNWTGQAYHDGGCGGCDFVDGGWRLANVDVVDRIIKIQSSFGWRCLLDRRTPLD